MAEFEGMPVVSFVAHVDPSVRSELASVVAEQTMLEQVVRWGLRESPPRLVAAIVKQDEYTLDVVLPFGELFLVYDST